MTRWIQAMCYFPSPRLICYCAFQECSKLSISLQITTVAQQNWFFQTCVCVYAHMHAHICACWNLS